MKRFNKIALIPAAIAAGLASNAAFAGTQACFEIYKGENALNTADLYAGASCAREDSVSAGTERLIKINEMSAAYELTRSLKIDFSDIDGSNDAGTSTSAADDQVIVYIPTTDIPGGTKIEIALNNAVFDGNSNQIHLLKDDNSSDPTVTTSGAFSAVASSDDTVDGQSTITFLTKAGITIGAGTRLVFSRSSTAASVVDIDPVGILIENTECTKTTSTNVVHIEALSAKTDGGTGYNIIGAVSEKTPLVDISAQFYALQDGTTADADVNAESTNADSDAITARTEFVFDADASQQLITTKNQVIYKTAFYNRGVANNLDRFITLQATDDFITKFSATSEPGTSVKVGLYHGQNDGTAGSSMINGVDVQNLLVQEEVHPATLWGSFGTSEANAPAYETDAIDVFTPLVPAGAVTETNPATGTSNLVGAAYNEMFYAVTNTSETGVMNFNYDVKTHYALDFDNDNYNDHCQVTEFTHNIDVNGAVLKVPYAVEAEGNFVRVTNEHDEAAEVTVDVFGESADGTDGTRKVQAVKLGMIPAQSSVVYLVADVISEAEAQKSYEGADGGYAADALGETNAASGASRHTLTFTVTAPRDTVHGVSVQKVLGGVDRVMPVLDQNEWSQ